MMRARLIAAGVAMAVLSACADPAARAVPRSPTYSQSLPADICDRFDFAPVVAAVDVGGIYSGPTYDHSGTEDQWYACNVLTQRRDGPDQYRYVAIDIWIGLYGQASSAAKAYDDVAKGVQNPLAFTAGTAQRAITVSLPDSYSYDIVIHDGNLLIHVSAVDQDKQPVAVAAHQPVEALAREAFDKISASAKIT